MDCSQPGLEHATIAPRLDRDQKTLWVGLGFQSGVSEKLLEAAIHSVFSCFQLNEAAIAGLATLDRKQNEPGLLSLSLNQNWPLMFLHASALKSLEVPHPSSKVQAAIGLHSVSEAAALMAVSVQVGRLCDPVLVVPKQIFRRSPESGAVTVAIAQISHETALRS